MDERRHEEAFESPSRRFAFEESDADSLKGESTIVKTGASDIRQARLRARNFYAGVRASVLKAVVFVRLAEEVTHSYCSYTPHLACSTG